MSLFIVSVCCIAANILLQSLLHKNVVDVISPLIAAVALVAPRKTAFAWAAVMGLLWAAFMDIPFLVLIAIWSALIWLVNNIARHVDRGNSSVGALIAIIVSFSWHLSALLFGWFSGESPTLDVYTLATIVIRPVSSAILFIVFWDFLIRAANPYVTLPGR